MSFDQSMETYALDPTPEHLEVLQRDIMALPDYDPLVQIAAVTTPLQQAGDHQGVVDALTSRMPGLFLAPGAHARLFRAYTELGDQAAADRERKFALLSMDAIRSSGTGEEEHPFRVLRVEDQYEVLAALGQHPSSQRTLSDERGDFDVHTVGEDREVWFELLWRERDRED